MYTQIITAYNLLPANKPPLLEKNVAERRHFSEVQFRAIYDSTRDAVMMLNTNGFVDCNDATLLLFGCESREKFCSYHPADLSPPEQPCGTNSMILANRRISTALEQGSLRFEWIHKRIDTGVSFFAEVLLNAIMLNEQFILHATVYDITARKEMVRCLTESNSKFSALLNSMAEGVYGTDIHGYCKFVNRSFLEILGYDTEDEIMGKHIHEVIHHSHADGSLYPSGECKIYNTYRLQKNIHVNDEVFWRKDGIAIPVEYRSQTIVADGILTGAIVTFSDITERQKLEREIKMLAFHDILTGLPNRRKLLNHINDSIKLSRRERKMFAIFMLDLDKFKAVNDTFGHAGGDDLLKQVATRVTARLRESDMVARLGGDEFVIVLENCATSDDAEKVASQVITDLTVPFTLFNGNTVQIGVSIGISFYPQHGTTPEGLIDVADRALYQAKENGRGRFKIFTCEKKRLIFK